MIRGSYHNGFAPRDGMPVYPSLWKGCVVAWAPCLGPTGLTLRDWSRLANHAPFTNMAAASAWVVNSGRYALLFDGTDDYISATNSQAFASGTQLTASIWVKRGATGTTHCLIGKWLSTATSNEDGWLLRWNNANVINFTVANSGSYGILASSSAYTSTDWNHIAVVHEFGSSSKTVLYLNGSPISATWTGGGTQVPDSDATSSPITLGALRYQGGPLQYFNGQMDDVRVYNRILNPNEVALLARRRGIAYDMMPMTMLYSQQAGFQAAWALRQRLILGGGGGLG